MGVVARLWSRIRDARSWASKQLAPMADHPLLGAVADMFRTPRELAMENAYLRQQVVVLRRKVKRPVLTTFDRMVLIAGASVLPTWRQTLAIVKPETILRWHRAGFRALWRRKSKPKARQRRITEETVALIREMASENRLWGAERIRGELLKLDVRVAKRTIQKYMRSVRVRSPGGQRWSTFVRNHADAIWCCDFVQTYDLFFQPVFAFIIVHLGSRRVVHSGTTRNPTQEWTVQQLRNATMDGEVPRFLIRDRDDKFSALFDRVAKGAGMRVIKTAVRAPDMNAVMERFLRSVRAEALDHVLVMDDRHLDRVVRDYADFFNRSRPHQGIEQRIPGGTVTPIRSKGRVAASEVLGGLHHDYRRAA